MQSIFSYGIAFLFALLVHAVVIGLISLNWEDSTISMSEIRPYYIEASVVAENPFTAAKDRAAQKETSARDQRLKNRREQELKFNREREAWEKRRLEELSKPQPDPEPIVEQQVVEAEPEEPQVDQEEVRAAFEDQLALALQREENARKAVTDDEKAMAYVSQIQREIIQNWSRPPSARNGMESLLRVRLIPTGEVVDVKVEKSSGNDSFDRSALLAVRKAGRFVVPSDARRFERDFREFTVLFRPEDLRL